MLTELDALIILTTFPHLGSIRIRFLMQYFGSAIRVLDASPQEIEQLPDFGTAVSSGWKNWRSRKEWQKNVELAEKHRVTIIPYTSAQYPQRLLEIPDYPIILYMKGKWTTQDAQSIAVIGTRQATIYGREMAYQISSELAAQRVTVISGLARGIDTEAHRGALTRGRTIAVIGSGLADIYPKENGDLAEEIAANGVLMSEFPMETPPDRQNFPQRNRIVSGMTKGTLLIEAPLKSGAMLTMERSLAYGRPLFALPGRVDSGTFQGNHDLIKKGQAKLIENAGDLMNHYEDLFSLKTDPSNVSFKIQLSKEETLFLDSLPNQELSLDEIVRRTALPMMKINVFLMSLLLKKAIKEYPGQIYKKVY